jgi:eukaryotic-like serine/threonine-protein kinase
MAQLMFKIANEAHADIRTHNAALPESLSEVVNRALAKEAEQRYQDGEQMAKALRLCLEGLAPRARAQPAPVPAAGTAPAA